MYYLLMDFITGHINTQIHVKAVLCSLFGITMSVFLLLKVPCNSVLNESASRNTGEDGS